MVFAASLLLWGFPTFVRAPGGIWVFTVWLGIMIQVLLLFFFFFFRARKSSQIDDFTGLLQ